MATILYRDGNAERIEPQYVEDSLNNGYFVTREESLGEAPIKDDNLSGFDVSVDTGPTNEDEGELGDADGDSD